MARQGLVRVGSTRFDSARFDSVRLELALAWRWRGYDEKARSAQTGRERGLHSRHLQLLRPSVRALSLHLALPEFRDGPGGGKDQGQAQAARKYARMLDDWFKAGERLLREKEEEVLAQAKLGVAGLNEHVASLTDVVEILRWYQHQIYVKLMRGLERDAREEAASALPKDADGSVKVALIAIDRSIAAWMRMKDFFPQKTDSVLGLLVALDRLRRSAEKEFPNARRFVRPGFDTEPEAR